MFLTSVLEKSILQIHNGKDLIYLQWMGTENWGHIEYKSAGSKAEAVLDCFIRSLVFREGEIIVDFCSE